MNDANQILRELQPKLRAVIVATFGAKHAHFDDLLQITLVAAWESLPAYDPERGSLLNFVRKHCVKKCFDYLGKQPKAGSAAKSPPVTTAPVEDLLDAKRIFEALDPGAQRILDAAAAGKPVRQIGAEVGASKDAVFRKLRAVRKR